MSVSEQLPRTGLPNVAPNGSEGLMICTQNKQAVVQDLMKSLHTEDKN